MRVSTAHRMKPGAILVVFAAGAIAASCAQGPSTPTAPSATTWAVAAHAAAGGQQSASSQESLLLTKTCGTDHCTVMTSSAGPIPAGSDIYYSGPLLEARTTSRIVVTTPGGDTATGNCSLSYRTFEGTCVLTDGTGALAGLHANLKVFMSDPSGVFTWEGRYHFVH